jgi:hypothetical protein
LAEGDDGGLGAVGGAEFLENIAHVALDGSKTEVEAFCDFCVADAFGYQMQYFGFARSERCRALL